jgi:hypothetical protein
MPFNPGYSCRTSEVAQLFLADTLAGLPFEGTMPHGWHVPELAKGVVGLHVHRLRLWDVPPINMPG